MATDWLHPALRFGHYALLLGLFGATAFRVTGLRPLAPMADSNRESAIILGAMLAPMVSVALMLVGVAAMMGQAPQSLELSTLEAIALTTSMGWAFLARMLLLVAGLAVLFCVKPMAQGQLFAAVCYGLALITLAWNGHAAATEGAPGLIHRLNDGLHLLVAGLWMGAIGWFTTLVTAAHREPECFAPKPLLAAMHGFAPFGLVLVGIVVMTGAISAQFIFGIENSLTMFGTTYGWLLIAKMLLVLLMLACAARNAATTRRDVQYLDSSLGSGAATLIALRISLASELALAVCVVLLVAFLGLAAPQS